MINLRSRQDIFVNTHNTDRWNLQDLDDAWQLWLTMSEIERRLYHLYLLQYRHKQYARSHTSFGEYWAMSKAMEIIFPYRDSRREWGSLLLNQTTRKIRELDWDDYP
jgi:hypothetical protein